MKDPRVPAIAAMPTSYHMRNSGSSRYNDDDISPNQNAISATIMTSQKQTTKSHKMKRPSSPISTSPVALSLLPPVTLRPISGGKHLQTCPSMPLEERQQRQMRSFLQNFLADEKGHFHHIIDLQKHALDTGITVTDATLQEVVNTVPNLRGLNLSGCTHITDASLWVIARHCKYLDTIYLAQCDKITDLGIRLLAHNCKLVVVDLSDCPQLNDAILQTLAAGCWMIQKFIMQRCRQISDVGIVKIAQCCKENLQYLDVSQCDRVGEYGDKALIEIGKFCPSLRVLDLFGCRHVHDLGVRAIAKGCPLLTTLKLTGCHDVSSVAIRALAKQCSLLETLSLAGCVKTTNQDLLELSVHCHRLTWLDVSGSPNIDAQGIRALAQHCSNLTYLNLSSCQRISDVALDELGSGGTPTSSSSTTSSNHCSRLSALCLANCPRITEKGVDSLTTACTNLITLDLTNCDQIGRRFLQKLIQKLEFVEWATGFFGYQPLPNAAELCRQRDLRVLRLRSAIKIQAAMRGCLARGGLYEAKLRFVEKRILPKIQARIRGFLVRKRLSFEKQQKLEYKAATRIAQAYRDLQLRRMLARAKRLRRIQQSEEEAALIFQKIYRGYCARKQVHKMREDIHRQKQFEARIRAMNELAAVKLQRAYRGHRGRSDAAMLQAAREANRRQVEREKQAAMCIQRVYRGHDGRRLCAQRIAELVHEKRRQDGATHMQKLFRGHIARRNARILRHEVQELQIFNAALTIQRYWRGLRDKHLSAVLLGLIKLRTRENIAAQTIQNAYRMYMSRGFAKALRLTMLAQKKKMKAAIDIQRVLRGHRARAEAEIQRELQKLQILAKPLFGKAARLELLMQEQRDKVESLTRKLQSDEAEEHALTLELEKTMQIKTKYHDSSRITGTPQRYLTQYLQVQLTDQLRAKRVEIALDQRNLEALTTALNDTSKQLRLVKRELEPLTEGVIIKTKENRTKRLQNKVRRERRAATMIQKTFRGFRVRCASLEGGNCWIKMWDEATKREYYYNTFSGETRWQKPLAMDIFHDNFAQPMSQGIGHSQQPNRVDISTENAINDAIPSKGEKESNWYEAFDDTVQATYYYNCETREYQWDLPETIGNAIFTDKQSSLRRQQWLEEQQQQDRQQLLNIAIRQGPLLGQWEKRVDPDSGHFFFYHPPTDIIKGSLSPRSVHASLGDTRMTSHRTARSVRSEYPRPLHWQYRYGYEYDAQGNLIESTEQRPIWTEHVDQASGNMYYYNALTGEYRWEKPEDFGVDYQTFTTRSNSSREWFHEMQKQSNSESMTARSQKTRALGKKWVEYIDISTQNTYYYNEITGETRWSLSPRSARDTSDHDDQISLALFAQVKQLRESPVPYSSRDVHITWMEAAIAAKDWNKTDALVQQIFLREQSQMVTEKNKQIHVTDTVEAVSDSLASHQAKPLMENIDASLPLSQELSPQETIDIDHLNHETNWVEYQDEAGNNYFYNQITGETSWTNPSRETNEDTTSAWEQLYDAESNSYYYNAISGEVS